MNAQKNLYLFEIPFPEPTRWIKGDEKLRPLVRKVLEPWRGRPPAGLAKVTNNLVKGLQKLGVTYQLKNRPEKNVTNDVVGLLHGPKNLCELIAQTTPCLTGPGILNSASEWADMFTNTRAVFNVQNCEWAAAMYRPIYGDKVKVWAMGVEHDRYTPRPDDEKIYDFLIYDKIRWRDTPAYANLLETCQEELRKANCTNQYIRYGKYPRGKETAYHDMLRQSRAMLYLSENETQGFAYNEALSMGVPILAWNFGKWCDPIRFSYGLDDVPATSIPYWDERCGVDFRGTADFAERLQLFLEELHHGKFAPREYVLDNLRLEQGAQRYLDIINEARAQL